MKIIKHPETNEKKTITGWANSIGITPTAMKKRIDEWPLEKALSKHKKFVFNTFENIKYDKNELIKVRNKIGITQKQAAFTLNIGYSSYVRMESGARPVKKTVLFALKYIRNSLQQRGYVKNGGTERS